MRLFARIILDTRPSGYAALTKNRSERFFPNIVLKHEGNMPFENDGLSGLLLRQ